MGGKKNKSGAGGGGVAGAALPDFTEESFWRAMKHIDTELIVNHLFAACTDESTGEHVNKLRAHGKKFANSSTKDGTPALVYAATHSFDEEAVVALLEAGADPNAKSLKGEKQTALHAAAWGQDDRLIKALLHHGKNIDLLATDGSGRTVFHILSVLGAPALVHYLFTLSFFAQKPQEGSEQQEFAPEIDKDVRENLKSIAVQPITALAMRDASGATPLHYALAETASGRGFVELSIFILQILDSAMKTHREPLMRQVNFILNLSNSTKSNALHVLAAGGDEAPIVAEIAKKLIELSCDAFAYDDEGYTPLHVFAATHSSPTVLVTMLKTLIAVRGADMMKEKFKKNLYSGDGCTLLHCAARGGNQAIVAALLQDAETFGADPLAPLKDSKHQYQKLCDENGHTSEVDRIFLHSPLADALRMPEHHLLIAAFKKLGASHGVSAELIAQVQQLVDEEAEALENEEDEEVEEEEEGGAEGDFSGHGADGGTSSTAPGADGESVEEKVRRAKEKRRAGDDASTSPTRKKKAKKDDEETEKGGIGGGLSLAGVSYGQMFVFVVMAMSVLLPMLEWIAPRRARAPPRPPGADSAEE